jgi:hypothetical protein
MTRRALSLGQRVNGTSNCRYAKRAQKVVVLAMQEVSVQEVSVQEVSVQEMSAEGEGGRAQLRCPCCGSAWCRCRLCGARYALGEAAACALPHGIEAAALYCRCGARLDGRAVETPDGRHVALLSTTPKIRVSLIERLRVRGRAGTRLARRVRASSRHPEPVRAADAR